MRSVGGGVFLLLITIPELFGGDALGRSKESRAGAVKVVDVDVALFHGARPHPLGRSRRRGDGASEWRTLGGLQ